MQCAASAGVDGAGDRTTKRVVFWVFFGTLFALLSLVPVAGLVFDKQPMDLAMVQLFLFGTISALIGGKVGGYLGAIMDEDACSTFDMGVLSSLGSLALNLAFPLIGTAIVGAVFFISWEYLWTAVLAAACLLLIGANRFTLVIHRIHPIDCCGWRVDASGGRLPMAEQPLRIKNWIAIVLGVATSLFAVLTVYMAILMRSQVWEPTMLGAMMYAMSGAGLGGLLSGWLAGLLDWHKGEPEHDNPIMVAGMSLMASMMGAMPSSMLGGMMALMGWRAIVPTVMVGLSLLVGYYLFLFRGKFTCRVVGMASARRFTGSEPEPTAVPATVRPQSLASASTNS